MSNCSYARLTNRSALILKGADVKEFLQGLITNDMDLLKPDRALYAALLTPQGKFLHDFLINETEDGLILDIERDRRSDLIRRLTMYKLRADVSIEDAADQYDCVAFFGGDSRPAFDGISYKDPRNAKLGWRGFLKTGDKLDIVEVDFDAYDRHRLSLGIPDGSRDIIPEKNFLLEANFEELNGVSFTKGCYVGQELTARTKHRAKVKKRLYQVELSEQMAAGTSIMSNDVEIGEIRSVLKGPDKISGIALVRLEKLAGNRQNMSGKIISITPPEYLNQAIED